MSVSVKPDVSSPLPQGCNTALDRTVSNSLTDGFKNKNDDIASGQECAADKSEPTTPKPFPMAFTIDFGDGKSVDNKKLVELAKKSQARHQRVQSMSASLTRPSPPAAQKPPMSVNLPRKTQGYNSEGYFSSDQEDSGLSGSVKLKGSPLAQNSDKVQTINFAINRHVKSPSNDYGPFKKTSKSPIVDGIMSRSDNITCRMGLNLPLKTTNSPYSQDINRTPSYSTIASCYQTKYFISEELHQSPELVLLADISSPELDILTPDNLTSTPEHEPKSPVIHKGFRGSSDAPDLLFRKCSTNNEPLYIDDDIDRQSNSSTGTYTIESNNYTEEQKARMSIDRTFSSDSHNNTLTKCGGTNEKDPELIFDFMDSRRVITKEPKREADHKASTFANTTFEMPKISKDKNVLEISCCYESPSENNLAAQTSKQIKSTRSYLEKIKNRVRTITEKTFAKSPPRSDDEPDIGSFTSVTTSGILSSKYPPKSEIPNRRRCSLTKSEVDQTDYVHRLSRESSVPVSLPSNKILAFEDTKFESSVMKNAQKAMRDDRGVPSGITSDQVVGKLSHISLNRCKGDKTWIQDWADSVKNYNNNSLAANDSECTFIIEDQDKPPLSPRHVVIKSRSPCGGTPTKIPSPVGTLLHRRTPDLIPHQDTETYLLKTQNAISNLQAKLHSSRTNNFSNIPSQLTSSLISEKTAVSRLPVSQLSRSNSLNYRLRNKDSSGDSSPLRSPGSYVITGSTRLGKPHTNTSRSIDTEHKDRDSNMNSPSSDRQLSNSSDDKTLSNRPQYDVEAILSPHRKTHVRHKSFDGQSTFDKLGDAKNANQTVSLKTVLKNNALEAYPRIDQTRYHGDVKKAHQRVSSDGSKGNFRNIYVSNDIGLGATIRRSSSFNTVNRNNNYLEPALINSRRSSGNQEYNLSDESDGSYDKSQELRFKRPIHRGRIDSPDLKSIAPVNSPKCPNTPEPQRKFGPGLVRNSVRVTSKDRGLNRICEPVLTREEKKPVGHQSRKISEPTRQTVLNRLTKSRSSTREFQPKNHEKGQKKPSQHRSSSALASKELEFSNWKKRSSYDPMKAAREGKRRQQAAKRPECNKDDLSSPSHSSPVHRSQSFHTTNIADLTLDYSSEGTEDDQVLTLPIDPMITSTHSDILDLRSKGRDLRKQAMTNDVVLSRDYVTSFQVNQPTEKSKRRSDAAEKRKTYILDDITPTKENIDFLTKARENEIAVDKRKTFILDSDTNSTTNGSSPRNSSIFSQEKNSLTTCTSDTDGESGAESAPVRRRGQRGTTQPKQRHSGDYSMSSSTTSISQQKRPKEVQPRYLDISKYKNETSPKTFLKRDPSKTYVGVLGGDRPSGVSKGSAQHYEMEQKKQELEKWKRRASYDPRKAAALGKANAPAPKAARA